MDRAQGGKDHPVALYDITVSQTELLQCLHCYAGTAQKQLLIDRLLLLDRDRNAVDLERIDLIENTEFLVVQRILRQNVL